MHTLQCLVQFTGSQCALVFDDIGVAGSLDGLAGVRMNTFEQKKLDFSLV